MVYVFLEIFNNKFNKNIAKIKTFAFPRLQFTQANSIPTCEVSS